MSLAKLPVLDRPTADSKAVNQAVCRAHLSAVSLAKLPVLDRPTADSKAVNQAICRVESICREFS